MHLLTVAAGFDSVHHDILRRHERKLRHEMFCDDLRVDDKAVHYIHDQIEDAVAGQEAFRYGEALICRIVKSALEPLNRGCDRRIQGIRDDIARKAGDTLGTHRVPLISHGR